MKQKRAFVLESPTMGETLRFIEHEVSTILARTNIDWNLQKTYPAVSISLGCPYYYVTPYLYSPALDNYTDDVLRQIGIIPARDSLSGHLYLPGLAVIQFSKTHKAEILAFLGKDLQTDDEASESFGEPLIDAARETEAGL